MKSPVPAQSQLPPLPGCTQLAQEVNCINQHLLHLSANLTFAKLFIFRTIQQWLIYKHDLPHGVEGLVAVVAVVLADGAADGLEPLQARMQNR